MASSNHPEEPIILLAHPDRHALPKAVAAVSIEYEPLTPIFTIEESERRTGRHGDGRHNRGLIALLVVIIGNRSAAPGAVEGCARRRL